MPQLATDRLFENNSQLYKKIVEIIERIDELQTSHPSIAQNKPELRRVLKASYQPGANADTIKLIDMMVNAVVLPAPVQAASVGEISTATAVPVDTHHERERVSIFDVGNCHRCHHRCCSCRTGTDSFWFWMLMLSTPRTTVVEHHHHDSRSESKNKSDPLLAIIIFLTVLALLASAIFASIHIFGQIADAIERLANHEGSSYAWLTLGWLGLSAAGGFTAASFIVPLILTATAAANPVAWGIFGIIMLGLAFTALIHMLVPGVIQPMCQKDFEKTFCEDSFKAKDMGRVQLTDEEKIQITAEGKDSEKVAIAIALLRHSMGPDGITNRFGLNALFFKDTRRTDKQQEALKIIRALRQADFEAAGVKAGKITVGNVVINLISMPTENINAFPEPLL